MRGNRMYLRRDVIKKRRKRAMLRAFWLGSLSLLTIASVIFSLRQEALKITSYSIEGVIEGNEQSIRQILNEYVYADDHNLIPLNTIVTIPTGRIESLIEQDHIVADVNVYRKMSYPFSIGVAVVEKKITQTLCIKESIISSSSCAWYGMDDEGYAIKKLSQDDVLKASSTLYMKVSQDIIVDNDEMPVLGRQIISPDLIKVIFAYSLMLAKHNYNIEYYELFGAKTYIHIKNNGYVIVPVGITTRPEFEIDKKDIEDKVMYLESVIRDKDALKGMYATTTAQKQGDLIHFEYIDARLAKKIFIDPTHEDSKTKDSQISTSTKATTTKPN